MAFSDGTILGSYEIVGLLGKGGMGEVYRSRDTRLKRDVAIKVLPPEFSIDPERIHRFQREAEVLATLNHPHIAQIYGIEQASGTFFLVLELVEGETLADRLRRSSIPIDDALDLARQIAEALESAHERDIVHRDLKPANVKITPDGKTKVLDFGLAKSIRRDEMDAGTSQSPTMVSGTMAGVILGTAAYMSPEQAKGRLVDARSDIWAFGVVLFEALTGKPAFAGETVVEIISAVLRAEPDWNALPEGTPPEITSLLRRCLQKDPSRRLRDIADARFQIEDALATPARHVTIPVAVSGVRKNRERMFWIAAMLILIVATIAVSLRRVPVDALEMRVQIDLPPGTNLTNFAISPDGRKIIFQATTEGKTQLWLRSLDSESAQPLAGTEDVERGLFWSPDSRSVGFFAGGQLKRLDLNGGLIRTLIGAHGHGGTWNNDGTILFAPTFTGPLYRISANGGEAVEVTRLDRPRMTGHIYPQFLPDGRHFLFYGYGPPESRGVYVGSLDSKETQRLLDADSTAIFVPPDLVLFGKKGSLQAQRLDLGTLKPAGEPILVTRQLAVDFDIVKSAVSGSSSAIAYRTSDAERQLLWIDRSGHEIAAVSAPDAALQASGHRLSPDERSAAVISTAGANRDVWLVEIESGISRRLSTDATWHCCPLWAPDGKNVLFASDLKGVAAIYEKDIDSSRPQTLVLELSDDSVPQDVSLDGRFVLYRATSAKSSEDLWAVPRFGEKKPVEIVSTPASEDSGRFSPDGHWIAYQSNETGKYEVWVQPFPGATGKRQITNGGGMMPAWGSDQRELFYVGPDNHLMTVPITTSGATLQTGKPTALFSLLPGSQYVVSRNSQRFLINKVVKEASPITLLLNWNPPAR